MKEKEFLSWGDTRKKGRNKFILVNGLLIIGLPMFIANIFTKQPFIEGFLSRAAIAHYLVWPTAGIFFGLSLWLINEYRYKKELQRRTSSNK